MDAVLRQYLGVSLKDTKQTGLDAFTYWEETDCYYRSHGDTNAIQVLVSSSCTGIRADPYSASRSSSFRFRMVVRFHFPS